MATSFTCDGCGKAVDTPTKLGHVLKRDYCQECMPKAEAFLDAEDLARIEVRATFLAKREALIAEHGKDFKLPDVA